MATKLVPLELEGIEEGRFLDTANDMLAELQERMVAFRKEHGDRAIGAKGKLVIEVALICGKTADHYNVASTMKPVMPARPAVITSAMESERADGRSVLFVRSSGSTADSPRQAVLCTEDGKDLEPSGAEQSQS